MSREPAPQTARESTKEWISCPVWSENSKKVVTTPTEVMNQKFRVQTALIMETNVGSSNTEKVNMLDNLQTMFCKIIYTHVFTFSQYSRSMLSFENTRHNRGLVKPQTCIRTFKSFSVKCFWKLQKTNVLWLYYITLLSKLSPFTDFHLSFHIYKRLL